MIALCFSLCVMGGLALAQTDLKAELVFDAQSYKAGDVICLTLEMTNQGNERIENISVTYEVPQFCMLQNGKRQSVDSLTPGGSAELQAAFAVTSTDYVISAVPETGDPANLLLWIVLSVVSVAGLFALGRKEGRKTAALLLCVFIGNGMFCLKDTAAESMADSVQMQTLRVSKIVRIDGKDTEFAAVIHYQSDMGGKDAGERTKNLDQYRGSALWDTLNDNTAFVYSESYSQDMTLPESKHFYEDGTDEVYSISFNKP